DVTHPSAAGDVVVEPRVTIHEYVDARAMLCCDMARETIEVLFAISEAGKTLRQRYTTEVLGVPIGTGQCAGRGG
ncbi:MAG: hypothetical protein WB019_02580, partial [Pseudolabrys sp.]